MGALYTIQLKNFEESDLQAQIDDTASGGSDNSLEGGEDPAILDTPGVDKDVTSPIKGKRLRIGFNSHDYGNGYIPSVDTFSDGNEDRFTARLLNVNGPTSETYFLGNLVLDENSEAFQPMPNPVTLSAGCGLGTLKDVELKTTDGEIPIGHFTIMDYIVMCLSNLPTGNIKVAMNLFEVDTDPDTSHAFKDIYLDALTFETDVNKREDCYTVLTKILEAFGCFITRDADWKIIRWTEFDRRLGALTVLRFATFDSTGALTGYTNENVDRIIVQDSDPDYDGYYLSMDSAIKSFQRKAGTVIHINPFITPREIPCNVGFQRVGAVNLPLSGVDYTAYDLVCWSFYRGIPQVSNNGKVYTKVITELGYEKERYTVFPAQPSNDVYYIVSEPFYVSAGDKVDLSALIKWTANIDTGVVSAPVMGLRFSASDGTYYYCDAGEINTPKGEWVLSTASASYGAGFGYASSSTQDDTDWQQVGFFDRVSDMLPKDGKLEVIIMQGWDVTTKDFHVKDIKLTYYPNISGSFDLITAQQHKVSTNDDTRKKIEKDIFIFDSPKPLFKGALKKYNGTDYVLTEGWDLYIETGTLFEERMSKHNVFAWWNQYRKTRTVIESDFQGMQTTEEGRLPGLHNRWKVYHGGQQNKYFMLTSIPEMNFKTCGWKGILVETSDADGDRDYTSDYEFKFIQGK